METERPTTPDSAEDAVSPDIGGNSQHLVNPTAGEIGLFAAREAFARDAEADDAHSSAAQYRDGKRDEELRRAVNAVKIALAMDRQRDVVGDRVESFILEAAFEGGECVHGLGLDEGRHAARWPSDVQVPRRRPRMVDEIGQG